ncbi:MAG: hypothetical protein IKD43_03960 [Clostridia bacterium]|nr:hypothetical protein [Clostridia bacterium]
MAEATIQVIDVKNTQEAREHERRISQNYQKLLDMASPTREREAARPVYTAPVAPEKPAFVRAQPHAPSGAARIADYTQPPAPAKTKEILFEDVTYKKGYYTSSREVVEERYELPVMYDPVPKQQVAPIEDEAIPTAATMIHRTAAEEVHVGFWAALSAKTKLLLATVGMAIVVAVMIVCVNTAVINSINADIAAKQARLNGIAHATQQLEQEIEDLTDVESVGEWAQQNGMVKE